MLKIKALLKFLENHRADCAVWTYVTAPHCTCGRNEAVRELREILTCIVVLDPELLGDDFDLDDVI